MLFLQVSGPQKILAYSDQITRNTLKIGQRDRSEEVDHNLGDARDQRDGPAPEADARVGSFASRSDQGTQLNQRVRVLVFACKHIGFWFPKILKFPTVCVVGGHRKLQGRHPVGAAHIAHILKMGDTQFKVHELRIVNDFGKNWFFSPIGIISTLTKLQKVIK